MTGRSLQDVGVRDVRGCTRAVWPCRSGVRQRQSTVIRGPHRGAQSGTRDRPAPAMSTAMAWMTLLVSSVATRCTWCSAGTAASRSTWAGSAGVAFASSAYRTATSVRRDRLCRWGAGTRTATGWRDVRGRDDHAYVVYGKRDSAAVDLRRLGTGRLPARGDAFWWPTRGDVNGDGRNGLRHWRTRSWTPETRLRVVRGVVFSAAPGAPVDPAAPTGINLWSAMTTAISGKRSPAPATSTATASDVIVAAPKAVRGGAETTAPSPSKTAGASMSVYGKRDARRHRSPFSASTQGSTDLRQPPARRRRLGGPTATLGSGIIDGDDYRSTSPKPATAPTPTVVFGGAVTGTLDISHSAGAGILRPIQRRRDRDRHRHTSPSARQRETVAALQRSGSAPRSSAGSGSAGRPTSCAATAGLRSWRCRPRRPASDRSPRAASTPCKSPESVTSTATG